MHLFVIFTVLRNEQNFRLRNELDESDLLAFKVRQQTFRLVVSKLLRERIALDCY